MAQYHRLQPTFVSTPLTKSNQSEKFFPKEIVQNYSIIQLELASIAVAIQVHQSSKYKICHALLSLVYFSLHFCFVMAHAVVKSFIGHASELGFGQDSFLPSPEVLVWRPAKDHL